MRYGEKERERKNGRVENNTFFDLRKKKPAEFDCIKLFFDVV